MPNKKTKYPASLDIDYPSKMDKFSTFFRLFYAVPIVVLVSFLTASSTETVIDEAGREITVGSGGITTGLFIATALIILFKRKYPKWWFDFNLELSRFTTRICAYILLLTDRYPSTDEHQSVHLNIDYPNAKKELNRWLPLVKWFLAIPHYIILIFLFLAVAVVTVAAWFAILFTGKYPKRLFDFVIGVWRWSLRVEAYAFILTTDQYPPFSLK
jgi:Domain of unknown function (DUF4389)